MRLFRSTLIAVGLMCAVAASVAAQPRDIGGVGVAVFDGPGYRGQNLTISQDLPSLAAVRFDNRISSFRVAPGEYWEVCEYANYRGQCQVFYNTEDDLRRSGWDNRISSMRKVRDDGGWGGGPGGGGPGGGGGGVPRDGLVLYDRTGFNGNRRVIRTAVRDLQQLGFNDDAQSAQVGGGAWELCQDNMFRNCRVVSSDVANLQLIGLLRRVSSVRPYNGGPQIQPPRPPIGIFPPMGGRLELFDDRNFRGRSRAFDGVAPSLGDLAGRADSVRLSGRWEICDQPNFRGRCQVVESSLPDLGGIGWRNRIRSARPR